MKDNILDKVWPFWIQRHAFWINSWTSFLPTLYEQYILRIFGWFCRGLFEWRSYIFQRWKKILKIHQAAPWKTTKQWFICKMKKMCFSYISCRVFWLYPLKWLNINGYQEDSSYVTLNHAKNDTRCSMFF